MPLIDRTNKNAEGMVSIKIAPGQIELDDKGRIIITDADLLDFLKTNSEKSTATVELMGSDCGSKCCC